MAYLRPDSNRRAYIYTDTSGRTVLDLCGKKKLFLEANDAASHDNAFALFLAVSDYLVREGYFDPDGLESSKERYNQVYALLNNPEQKED